MSGAAPAVFTIPPGVPFARALARGLLRRAEHDPLALAAMTVLLPNRRAVRALGEAFLDLAGGRATLLPRMVPLGDLDDEGLPPEDEALFEIPLEMAPTRRLFLLAQLVERFLAAEGRPTPTSAAIAELAAELAALLDEAATFEVDLGRLDGEIPVELAAHWEDTRRFLAILREAWPAVEAEAGAIGPAARRNLLLARQAARWRSRPPEGPVIAAGSTGSIPAVARLLAVVARLPQGAVVLPGLDHAATPELWEAIAEDPTHPQHGLALLLATLEVEPRQVRPWEGLEPSPRSAFLQAALRPASATDSWDALAQGATAAEGRRWSAALSGLVWLDCATPRSEAEAIALLLRRGLERPGRTAALVTPDRGLARRVAAELGRWDIAIDDSAGRPLALSPPAVFLRLVATAAQERLAPVALLALLKHPLAAGGLAPAELRRRARRLERGLLRGPRPAPEVAGLQAALAAEGAALAELAPWIADLGERLAPLGAVLGEGRAPLDRLLRAHIEAAEALAATETEPGGERLWAGEAGEALSAALTEILAEAASFPPPEVRGYPALFDQLLAGRVLRPRWGRHPRLYLWGPLEARLQQADLMILGGLNEGTWPAEVDPGPWINRPLRRALGLPAPERRLGQAAHDVAQALAAPRVVVTRALKVEGTPTRPARWLLRIEALAKALGLARPRRRSAEALGLADALDRPEAVRPCPEPAPRPPLQARPRRLAVTDIELWQQNPYGLYAKRVLGLRALAPLDEDPSAAERGRLIHGVLEAFAARWPGPLPPNPRAELLRLAEAALAGLEARPGLALLWRPRLLRALGWYLAQEEERRGAIERIAVELTGTLQLQAPGGPFQLTAKADRLELRRDGSLVLVDYKTGLLPRSEDVLQGLAPQLPLEGAIALAGGFAGFGARALGGLEFWHLTGNEAGGELKRLDGAEALATDAADGLAALVAAFDDPASPYLAHPRDRPPRFDDYAHLARIKEWAAREEGA